MVGEVAIPIIEKKSPNPPKRNCFFQRARPPKIRPRGTKTIPKRTIEIPPKTMESIPKVLLALKFHQSKNLLKHNIVVKNNLGKSKEKQKKKRALALFFFVRP